jgi:hypothetical protein
MDETAVCAALNAALTEFSQGAENRFLGETDLTAWDVVAACDALMTAESLN